MNFLDQFKAARMASIPLVVVNTPDPAATMLEIIKTAKDNPVIAWDIVRGVYGVNKEGKEIISAMSDQPDMLTNPVEALVASLKLPEKSILFYANVQRYLGEITVIQAIWNLRDKFKGDTRMFVGLAPSVKLPAELANDVLVLDEPLPTVEQLTGIVAEAYSAAELKPKKEDLSKAGDAVSGLPAFPAEQACFMSMKKDGLDFDYLWERKRQNIGQTMGLSVWRGTQRFVDIGGCANVKTFLSRVLAGENPARAIVFIDEIEKALAGAGGDTSGTSQEMLGTLLTFMQDKNSTGMLFIGPPGAAKSEMAKAAGNEGGIPTINFDLSGMKGSLVGESGANIRNALKVVEAVSQNRALFIATCNSIGVLPPELRRRFSFGTFFFDLPNDEERAAIWKIYLSKYKIKDTKKPLDTNWTGAEIKQCCDLAFRLRCPLEDAAAYIVPVAKSAAEQIENLRKQANGRFISASNHGIYKTVQDDEPKSARRLATVF